MTLREKILYYLSILEVEATSTITLMDLKQKYLYFAKKYSPEVEEYKDGKKYYEMKSAYDYLYDHIDLVNAEIEKINSGIPDSEKEIKEESKVEEVVRPVSNFDSTMAKPMPESDLKAQDRPTVFGILMSILSPIIGILLFALLKRVAPKSSWIYLIIAILGIALNVLLYVMILY